MNKFLTLVWAILLSQIVFAQKAPVNRSVVDLSPAACGEIVKHSFYTLAYSEQDEQPYWVYYVLTPDFLAGSQPRKDAFRADPAVRTGSASLADYSGSGYDRGHLCPAGDMVFNARSMSESFYLSNMSPQEPSFNRGIWKKLEALVRQWAKDAELTYVVTGGILANNKGHIGPGRVTVPGYYYKAVYCPGKGMIGFVLPNEGSNRPVSDFIVSVDRIEELTKLDLFAKLPDAREKQLEASVDPASWGFAGHSQLHAKAPAQKAATPKSGSPVQCAAKTKSGSRCKRMAAQGSKYCWQHKK
ncbi:DNA/RNA non-specific endonuclease [Mangrovibacterium marinum]|uniref:Endonuclease n=1 Tax=Mangrovibacterium marinum TaxID=1639118 RepID=A0A2T5C5B4_9BACT|nr:DNA/RNA non-specific endonuclease [Mangrovibacterium marinum]PTN10062.1 endonuclease G [Mangrovibacterium marinum]